jgi:hypothetical protein
VNVPFRFPFTHGLISTLQARSLNPRGALYALINCPCFIFCSRGVVQLALLGNDVSFIHDFVMIGVFVVPRLSVTLSIVSIFPSLLNSAPAFTACVGWIYSLITFWL